MRRPHLPAFLRRSVRRPRRRRADVPVAEAVITLDAEAVREVASNSDDVVITVREYGAATPRHDELIPTIPLLSVVERKEENTESAEAAFVSDAQRRLQRRLERVYASTAAAIAVTALRELR